MCFCSYSWTACGQILLWMNGPAWLLLGLPGLKWVSETKKQVQLKTNKNDILYTGFQQVWINIKSNYPYIRFALYYFGKYLGRPLTRVLKQGSNKCRDHHWCSKIGSPEVGSKPTCLNSVRPFPRWEGKTKNSSHQINLSDYHLFIWQNLYLYIFYLSLLQKQVLET